MQINNFTKHLEHVSRMFKHLSSQMAILFSNPQGLRRHQLIHF